MEWEKLDWNALDRLREGFLSGSAARGVYWRSLSDLENYDLTYGERIGWKWDAVLNELIRRGWRPHVVAATPADTEPSSASPAPTDQPLSTSEKLTVLDWGCGSGVAGRRVIEAFGADKLSTLLVWDHSQLARAFAMQAAKKRFPKLMVGELRDDSRFDLLVVSHVLNELSDQSRAELLALVRRAHFVLWVEPGTHAVSRDLIGIRETLRDEFQMVAPCTHSQRCGLLALENTQHWCHYFASPPAAIYADSDWVKFGQRAGIDLRSLPYSFLVAERIDPLRSAGPTTDAARIVGEPRHYKGFAKLLSCDPTGVTDLMLQKRDDPTLYKALKRDRGVPIYRWTRDGDRIKQAQPLFPEPPTPDFS